MKETVSRNGRKFSIELLQVTFINSNDTGCRERGEDTVFSFSYVSRLCIPAARLRVTYVQT